MLFDLNSGKVLEHQDAFRRWYPASLTKLMTAYVTFRAVAAGELALDSPIKVTKHAAAEPPSKMGFKPGSVMTLDNALKMMLVKSANDIAMAVGENVGGSEEAFVVRMNAEAQRLGMTGIAFRQSERAAFAGPVHDGARPRAAGDARSAREFPQYAPYFSIEGIKAGKKTLMSYNLLVGRYPGADGMKTGFVCASGFNMIGSATRGGKTLVAIVLGEKSAVERTDDVGGAARPRLRRSRHAAARRVASLPAYGTPRRAPDRHARRDLRQEEAGKHAVRGRAPTRQRSREIALAGEDPQSEARRGRPRRRHRARCPLAMRDQDGQEYADVPIPTPRPDYPPVAKAVGAGRRRAAN